MRSVISKLNFRSLLGRLLSYITGLHECWDSQRLTGNTASSSCSKKICEFHCDNYRRYTKQHLQFVAELRPVETPGTFISALCDGVERAIGLDIFPYVESSQLNQETLDDLWTKPRLNHKFEELVKVIKQLGSPLPNTPLEYVARWISESVLLERCIDFVLSHSVLDHVDHPADAYKAYFRWLKPSGIMSHKINHSSHGITSSWTGHYAISKYIWRLIRGLHPYLLNRLTPSEYRALLKSTRLKIFSEKSVNETGANRNTIYTINRGVRYHNENDDVRLQEPSFYSRQRYAYACS